MRTHRVSRHGVIQLPNHGLLTKGLLCDRRPMLWLDLDATMSDVPSVNVLQELWPYGACGMDWHGNAPPQWTLALNILDRFCPPGLHEAAEVEGVQLHCSERAAFFHRGFAAELLASVPFWGGEVSADLIREWLSRADARWARYGIDLAAEGEVSSQLKRSAD